MAEEPGPRLSPGQAVMFLGNHTSPDDIGFVGLISDVLGRFHPALRLNLISAGSARQTAARLRSRALLDLLNSSRPDWLVINVGLADALREPQLEGLLSRYRAYALSDEAIDNQTLGPEHRLRPSFLGPHSDSGTLPAVEWARLPLFRSNLAAAVGELCGVGIRCVLVTTVAVSDDLQHPLNLALRAYNRVVRDIAGSTSTPLVDVERAFRNVLERAGNYKQKVALADETGSANPQGQALIARTFLHAFGLLPQPGLRPPR